MSEEPDPQQPSVENRTTVLVLQHPQEQDRVLGSAGLLCRTLSNARLAVGLSWRNLAQILGEPADPRDWGVLYLGSTRAADKGPLVALDRGGEPLPDQLGARQGLAGIVALDGNWAQAKALWWRNAWLTKLRRFVVVPDGPSLYGELRREARPDAVSTIEAVALALSALEDDPTLRPRLLAPFRALLDKARAEGISDNRHGQDAAPRAPSRDRRRRGR